MIKLRQEGIFLFKPLLIILNKSINRNFLSSFYKNLIQFYGLLHITL